MCVSILCVCVCACVCACQVPDVHHGSGDGGGVELCGGAEPPFQNPEYTRHDGVDQRGTHTHTLTHTHPRCSCLLMMMMMMMMMMMGMDVPPLVLPAAAASLPAHVPPR